MNTNLLSSQFSGIACLFAGCEFAFFSFVKLLKQFIINTFTVLEFTSVDILEITSSR